MPWLTHSSFITTASSVTEQSFYAIPNIERNENSRTSGVNELPQMCFSAWGLGFHTNANDWDLFSEEVRRLVGVLARLQRQSPTTEP